MTTASASHRPPPTGDTADDEHTTHPPHRGGDTGAEAHAHMGVEAQRGPRSEPRSATPRPRLSMAWWGIAVRFAVAVAILLLANDLMALAFAPLIEAAGDDVVLAGSLVAAQWSAVFVAIVLAVWGWMRIVERRPMRTAGWRWSWGEAGWFGVGIAASIVVVAATVVIGAFLPMPEGEPLDVVGDAASLPVWLVLVIVLVRSFLLQGIPEELLFRGWLFSLTEHRPLLTVVWTTLAFTVIHLASSGGQQSVLDHVLYLAIPLGFGALAGALVLVSGSMWVAAGVHGGFHIAITLTGALVSVAPTAVDWLLVGATYLVATAIVLAIWQARRRAGAPQRRLDGSVARLG